MRPALAIGSEKKASSRAERRLRGAHRSCLVRWPIPIKIWKDHPRCGAFGRLNVEISTHHLVQSTQRSPLQPLMPRSGPRQGEHQTGDQLEVMRSVPTGQIVEFSTTSDPNITRNRRGMPDYCRGKMFHTTAGFSEMPSISHISLLPARWERGVVSSYFFYWAGDRNANSAIRRNEFHAI